MLQLQNAPTDAGGTLSNAMTMTTNLPTAGRLRVSAFSTTALSGAGTLLNLTFNAIGGPWTATALTWESFTFNEGEMPINPFNGRFNVSVPTSAPTVATTAASSIITQSATLNSEVIPNGATTNAFFE